MKRHKEKPDWIDKSAIECVSAIDHACERSWHTGTRSMHDSMIYLFHGGRATGEVGDPPQDVSLGPGELLLVPEGVRQTLYAAPRQTVQVIVVHFTARLFLSRDLLGLHDLPLLLPATETTKGACRRLCREFNDRPPGWRLQMQAVMTQLLVELVREHGQHAAPNAPADVAALNRIEPLLHWIEDHFRDTSLQVGHMARRLGVSEMTLRRLFRRALDVTPVGYINHRRMDHASRALRQSHQSVQEIAYDAGFNDIAYFYRCFEKHAGTTPGAYRTSA